MKPTLRDYSLNGRKALEEILRSSCYGSFLQTVASLTAFSHPQTVAQTTNQNVFRMVRDMKRRSQADDVNKVVYDDNAGPQMVFIVANKLKSIAGKIDLQLNHIWDGLTQDVRYYTLLSNLCVTPAFLAKLTDHSPEIQALLRFRAYELYTWHPMDKPQPSKPPGYDQLEWAAPLDPVFDLEKEFREHMRTKSKNRVVVSARRYGWFFSDWQPDGTNLLSELQPLEQPQYLDGTDKTSLGATQREFMQKLFSEHTGDKKRVIEEYAKAEERGEIKRKRNRFGVTPKQYAYQLFADGVSKGWLQK
jgi:hypothetical protein